jgi:hypothetical protein
LTRQTRSRTITGLKHLPLLVVALSLAARAAAGFVLVPAWEAQGIAPFPDRYPVLAASLLDRGELGYAPEGATPTTARGPGFPLWLAVGMALGGRAQGWIALWASLPGALAAGLVARLLLREAGPRAALLGGLLAGLHPLAVFTSARGMSDEFVGALLLGAVAVVSRDGEGENGHSLRPALTAGALLAAAILARATAALALVAIVAAGLGKGRSKRALALLAAVALLPPLAWSVRSSLLEGRPVFVHSLAAYNWWCGEVLETRGLASRRGETSRAMVDTIVAKGEVERDPARFWYGTLAPRETASMERALAAAAVLRIREDPLAYAVRVARGTGWFWIRGETRGRTLQYAALVLPVLALAAVGAVRGRMGLAAAIVLLHVLAYAAVYPSARMAVQVWPLVAWMAGRGSAVRPGKSTRRPRRWSDESGQRALVDCPRKAKR